MEPLGLSFFGTSLWPFVWSKGLISDVVDATEATKKSISKLHGLGLACQCVKRTSTAWVVGGHAGQEASRQTALLAESRLSPGLPWSVMAPSVDYIWQAKRNLLLAPFEVLMHTIGPSFSFPSLAVDHCITEV